MFPVRFDLRSCYITLVVLRLMLPALGAGIPPKPGFSPGSTISVSTDRTYFGINRSDARPRVISVELKVAGSTASGSATLAVTGGSVTPSTVLLHADNKFTTQVDWTLPSTPGHYTISVQASDIDGQLLSTGRLNQDGTPVLPAKTITAFSVTFISERCHALIVPSANEVNYLTCILQPDGFNADAITFSVRRSNDAVVVEKSITPVSARVFVVKWNGRDRDYHDVLQKDSPYKNLITATITEPGAHAEASSDNFESKVIQVKNTLRFYDTHGLNERTIGLFEQGLTAPRFLHVTVTAPTDNWPTPIPWYFIEKDAEENTDVTKIMLLKSDTVDDPYIFYATSPPIPDAAGMPGIPTLTYALLLNFGAPPNCVLTDRGERHVPDSRMPWIEQTSLQTIRFDTNGYAQIIK